MTVSFCLMIAASIVAGKAQENPGGDEAMDAVQEPPFVAGKRHGRLSLRPAGIEPAALERETQMDRVAGGCGGNANGRREQVRADCGLSSRMRHP